MDYTEKMTLEKTEAGVEYFTFNNWKKFSTYIGHGFTGKKGGISPPPYDTLNLSFTRGDEPENVMENYKRLGDAAGFEIKDCVCTKQIHGASINIIDSEKSKEEMTISAYYREDEDREGIDGLITDMRGTVLFTYHADCCPIYFYDPVRQVIGLAHAGHRGTRLRIAEKMTGIFRERFRSKPKDILVGIGPSISQRNYQVDRSLYDLFQEEWTKEELNEIFKEDGEDHYKLDMWKANIINLKRSGIPMNNIEVAGICSYENENNLFSHRRTGEKRGNNAAFLWLK